MRSISKLSVLCLAAGVMTACALPDEVISTENIPTAGVRFINAVPDTMAVDFRFTDIVESNAHFRIGFRASPVSSGGAIAATQVQYKNARAGLRKFSVFLDDTTQAIAQTKLLNDSTFQFDAGKLYTVMMWGSATTAVAADKMRFSIWEEAAADPSPNAAVRIINATNTPVDVWSYRSDSTAGGTPQWDAVAAYTAGSYVNFATHVITGNSARTRKFHVVQDGLGLAGASYITCPDPSALPGTAASADIEALPGTGIAGTALTGIVFPGSKVGTKAVQFPVTTGATTQIVNAAGTAYESARSYITDGFCVGQVITADTGWAAANEGSSTITAVSDGSTTTTTPSGTGANSTRFITATLTGYARVNSSGSNGSFVADGFQIGDNVTASGFSNSINNGVSTVTVVTPTALTVTKTSGTAVEAGFFTGSISVQTGVLAATGGTYVRSVGSWTTDGFRVGHALNATGFAATNGANLTNNGASTVSAISGDGLSMTVSKATGMSNEAAGTRTIAVSTGRSIIGFGRMTVTPARTAEAAGANAKTLTVTTPPPGLVFVWDRRPPRTACSPLC
jgi:hypothetical protein